MNSSSLKTVIPNELALSSFDPASVPAMTTSVAFETEPVTFAPRFSNRSVASFRPIKERVPVSTMVFPEKKELAACVLLAR